MIKETALKIAFIIILLTAINSCYYERESNDELEICFIRNNNIWTMNIDGTNQKQITFTNNNYAPSWSPDGKRILFSNDSTTKNIYIINSDGTNLKKITNSIAPNFSSSATWSANGEKIYYYEKNSSHTIIAAEPDGSILKKYPVSIQANYMSVSPDDKYIYFNDTSLIYKLDLLTGIDTSLSISTTSQISFSPDGKYFAHSNGAVFIHNIENDNTINFSNGTAFPCWTPEGKSIFFLYGSNIYKINTDGTNQQQLTFTNDCYFPCVKWKPI